MVLSLMVRVMLLQEEEKMQDKTLNPIHLSATLQFIIPTPTESMHIMNKNLMGIQTTLISHTQKLSDISNNVIEGIESIQSLEVLYEIRDKLNKRIHLQTVESSFLKTSAMAQNLSVSKSFLEKNMGDIFEEGTHYTRTTDARMVRWDIEEMHKWMRGEKRDETDTKLLSKLLG